MLPLAVATEQLELVYIWDQATPEAKVIIVILLFFSIVAWTVMVFKALQMRRAKKLNQFFATEFKTQKTVLDMFDRRIQAEGCPLFAVYQAGSVELDARLKSTADQARKKHVSLKAMEHVKRLMENAVAQESLKLESGLILLAIAVSGGPFLGLLGTVWGVMSTFARHRPARQRHDGGHGPGRFRRAGHHRGGFAGRDSFDVRLQLARA